MRKNAWASRPGGLLCILFLLALPVAGCGNGDECDTCTSDSDCNAELVCSSFSDGSQRCGGGVQGQETECKVR
jgi:hypothetical protein